jgi:hypothetical protein
VNPLPLRALLALFVGAAGRFAALAYDEASLSRRSS